MEGGLDRELLQRGNTLGHQLHGALFSLRQGQHSFICQHVGRKSSNVLFEVEVSRDIRCQLTCVSLRRAADLIGSNGRFSVVRRLFRCLSVLHRYMRTQLVYLCALSITGQGS